jgi:hypothetical protein
MDANGEMGEVSTVLFLMQMPPVKNLHVIVFELKKWWLL